jgi:BolA family transcriptional regulator, general stress-responsive regulator
MNVKERMTDKLTRAFSPVALEVIDDSHKHAGHSGWRAGGETHFSVRIVSAAFAGKNRVQRHREINAVLAEELQGGVHALAIEARAAGE